MARKAGEDMQISKRELQQELEELQVCVLDDPGDAVYPHLWTELAELLATAQELFSEAYAGKGRGCGRKKRAS